MTLESGKFKIELTSEEAWNLAAFLKLFLTDRVRKGDIKETDPTKLIDKWYGEAAKQMIFLYRLVGRDDMIHEVEYEFNKAKKELEEKQAKVSA